MIRIANHHLSSGPDRDVTEALRWLERAAQDGDAYTRNRLAQIYKNGAIVPRDVNAAARWTLAAAEDGASGAMVEAGYNAEIGRGVPRDPEVAAEWYFRALEVGNTLVLARAPSDWDRETARALQRMMSVSPRASYRGPIDGIAGAGTARAMSQLCNCSWARRIDRFTTHF